MKTSLFAVSMLLLTSVAHAEDLYKLEATVSLNGKSVGEYSAVADSGSTVRFDVIKDQKYTLPANDTSGEKVEEILQTGFRFTGKPVPHGEGKILLVYTAEYSSVVPGTNNKTVDQDDQFAGKPLQSVKSISGAFVAISGKPTINSMMNSKNTTDFTITVTKL